MVLIELQSYSLEPLAADLSARYGFSITENFDASKNKKTPSLKSQKPNNLYRLVLSSKIIYLLDNFNVKVYVDFVEGELAHRRKFGGGKGQMLAKAVGLNKGFVPKILDATAGLGGDAFILASLGCQMTMIERSPIARLLLADGLKRAQDFVDLGEDDELASVIKNMTLVDGDSLELLELDALESASIARPDVVYLDPMFPERKKSAQVKKGMKAFHDVIGEDADADQLLSKAMVLAKYRVVVKRPKIAPHLDNKKPMYQLQGKSSRFDIYTIKAFPER